MDRDGVLAELAGPLRPLGIVEMASVLGGLRFVELSAFESLGRLAGPEHSAHPGGDRAGREQDRAIVWAAEASLAHAWRAGQLEALLPVSTGLPGAEECTRPPGPAAERFASLLAPGEASTWYELLAEAYELRLAHPHPSADGPVARTLGRLAADARRFVSGGPGALGLRGAPEPSAAGSGQA